MIRNHGTDWGCYQNNFSFTALVSLIWEFSVWIHTERFSWGSWEVRKMERNIGRTPESSRSPHLPHVGSRKTEDYAALIRSKSLRFKLINLIIIIRHLLCSRQNEIRGEGDIENPSLCQAHFPTPTSHPHHLTLLTLAGKLLAVFKILCSKVSC